jgi:hypothetical protein
MAFCGAYIMPSPISSSGHFAILLVASRLWMTSPRGSDDMTVTGCYLK